MPKKRYSKPHDRIVNFRLTDEQYAVLVSTCAVTGDSISQVARTALLQRLNHDTETSPAAKSLDQTLANLDLTCQRVTMSMDMLGESIRELIDVTARSRDREIAACGAGAAG